MPTRLIRPTYQTNSGILKKSGLPLFVPYAVAIGFVQIRLTIQVPFTKPIALAYKDEHEEDDWTDEDGRHIVIRLPYKEVKYLADIRPRVLARVRERLGEVA